MDPVTMPWPKTKPFTRSNMTMTSGAVFFSTHIRNIQPSRLLLVLSDRSPRRNDTLARTSQGAISSPKLADGVRYMDSFAGSRTETLQVFLFVDSLLRKC